MNRLPSFCFRIAWLWTLLVTGSANAACLALPTGLVSWWPGDANAYDIRDGNFGLLQNGATFATGKVGPAFSLDGVNDFVTIPHNPNLNPTGPFSVDAWIKANSVQFNGDGIFLIVDKSHGFADGTGWGLQGNPNGTVGFFFGKGGSGVPANFPFVNTSSNLLDDQWHHLAGVFTGSQLEIYLDGVLQNTTAFSGAPVNNTRDVSIGRSWGGGTPTRHFHGLVDEVGFFNRAVCQRSGGDFQCRQQRQMQTMHAAASGPGELVAG